MSESQATIKVVINNCYGGFGLSEEALKKLGVESCFDIMDRSDPKLVAVVEEMGDAANDMHSRLKIVEIPSNVEWILMEFDGNEWIAEKHRMWY